MIAIIEQAEEAVLRRYHTAEERFSEDVKVQPPTVERREVADELHDRLIESVMVGVPG